MDAKSEVKKRGLVWFLPALVACSIMATTNVKAWIGQASGTPPEQSSTSTCTDPNSCGCSGANYLNSANEECTGASWIYYEHIKDAPKAEVTFSPYFKYKWNNEKNTVIQSLQQWVKHEELKISEDCAVDGGGFWHYGVNGAGKAEPSWNSPQTGYGAYLMIGRKGTGLSFNLDGKYSNDSYNYGTTSAGKSIQLYTTTVNGLGHWETLGWGIQGLKWITDRTFYANDESESNRIMKNATLGHKLRDKVSGKEIYQATKVASSKKEVVDAYKAAYKAEYGVDLEGNDFVVGTWGFCYWPGMDKPEEVTLTAYRIDSDLNFIDQSGEKTNNADDAKFSETSCTKGQPNCTTEERGDITGYTFVGWCKTDKNCDSSKNWTGGTFSVREIQEDTAVYAIYRKKKHTLTIKACSSDGVSISGAIADVKSKPTPYGNKVSLTRGLNAGKGYTSGTFKGFAATITTTGAVTASCSDAKKAPKITTTSSSATYYVSGSSNPKETINVDQIGADGTIYAIYELPEFVLTRMSVDVKGNSLDDIIKPVTVSATYGKSAKVCRADPTPAGLEYKYWSATEGDAQRGIKITSGLDSEGKCYSVQSLTSGEKVLVVYSRRGAFQGMSSVAGGGKSSSTDWQSGNMATAKRIEVPCSVDGCTVEFRHYMKKLYGDYPGKYYIGRTSNYWVSGSGLGVQPKDTAGSYLKIVDSDTGLTAGGKMVFEDKVTLKPGQVVCEKLYFVPTVVDGTGSSVVKTYICASAAGKAQPDGKTLLDIQVKNDKVGNTYAKEVYAKPGDTVTFKTIYNPILQYTYNLEPEQLKISGVNGTFSNSTKTTLGKLFNDKKGANMQNWNNAFYIKGSDGLNTNISRIYTLGDSAEKVKEGNDQNENTLGELPITSGHVGKILVETASTNVEGLATLKDVRTTPKQVIFKDENNKNTATVETEKVDGVAKVIVPYNFTTSTRVTSKNGEVVYAGSTKDVKLVVDVGTKYNSKTNGTYATPVSGARRKIEVQYEGSSDWISYDWENIDDGDMSTDGKEFTYTVNVPDAIAGTKFCVRSVVWPQNSGADDNVDVENFGGEARSGEVCFIVAKTPSFQVWGGNLFVNGTVTVPVSNKNTLSGYGSGSYKFGSWSELGVFGNLSISGIFSGASVGYSDVNFLKNPGGSDKTNACLRSVLSFANDRCRGSNVTGNMAASRLTMDKNSLPNYIDTIAPGMDTKIGGGDISLDSDYAVTENGVIYWQSDSGLTITSSILKNEKTYVVYAKNVTIGGNLEYEDSSYSDLNEIPKLFIYAENNISINCAVSRIDAVLITKGDINTCGDSNDINSKANSNRLKINGAVITNTIHLNRTYGAGVGNASMVPAEIINYDTTLYMWLFGDSSPGGGGGSGDAATFTEVRREELAPRY